MSWNHVVRGVTLGVAAAALTVACSAPAWQAVHADTQLTVTITDKGFEPERMTATLNENVQIHVTNQGTTVHQFSIPYFRIYTQNLQPGQDEKIAFAPWSSGAFDVLSDPSGKHQPEFTGKFIVTKPSSATSP